MPPLYGETTGNYKETQSYHENKIVIGYDWIKTIYYTIGIIVVLLFIYTLRKKYG